MDSNHPYLVSSWATWLHHRSLILGLQPFNRGEGPKLEVHSCLQWGLWVRNLYALENDPRTCHHQLDADPLLQVIRGTIKVELIWQCIHCHQKMLTSTKVTFPRADGQYCLGFAGYNLNNGKMRWTINLGNNIAARASILRPLGDTLQQIRKFF